MQLRVRQRCFIDHPRLCGGLGSLLPLRRCLTAARVALKPPPDSMAETLSLRGELQGHTGWVTSIATPLDPNSDTVLSSSR